MFEMKTFFFCNSKWRALESSERPESNINHGNGIDSHEYGNDRNIKNRFLVDVWKEREKDLVSHHGEDPLLSSPITLLFHIVLFVRIDERFCSLFFSFFAKWVIRYLLFTVRCWGVSSSSTFERWWRSRIWRFLLLKVVCTPQPVKWIWRWWKSFHFHDTLSKILKNVTNELKLGKIQDMWDARRWEIHVFMSLV